MKNNLTIMNDNTSSVINQIFNTLNIKENIHFTSSLLYFFILQGKGLVKFDDLENYANITELMNSIEIPKEILPESWVDFVFNNIDMTCIDIKDYKHIFISFQEILELNSSTKFSQLFNQIATQFIIELEQVNTINLYQLIAGLFEIEEKASILLPHSINGNLIHQLENYKGLITHGVTISAFLQMMASGLLINNTYIKVNPNQFWDENTKYDYIIYNSLPLAGFKPTKMDNFHIENQFDLIILKGLKSLNENGKLIVTTCRYLYESPSSLPVIQKFIDEDLLEKFIVTDSPLAPMQTEILVFSKKKTNKDIVTFIDIRRNISKIRVDNETKIIDTSIIDKINSGIEEDYFLKHVHTNTIKKNDYSINFMDYLFVAYPEGELATLAEFCSVIPESNLLEEASAKFLSYLSFLTTKEKDSVFKKIKTISNHFDTTSAKKYDLKTIPDDCLVVNLFMEDITLSPKYFKNPNDKFSNFNSDSNIFVDEKLQLLSIDTIKADIVYLIEELNKGYVKQQIKLMIQSKETQVVTMKELLSIKICMPEIDIQKSIVREIGLIEEQIQSATQKKRDLIYDHKRSDFIELASLNHSLGTPRARIMAITTNLEKFISCNEILFKDINQDYKVRYGRTINESVTNIKNDINHITELINISLNGLDLSKYEIEHIEQNEFIDFLNSFKYQYTNFDLNIVTNIKIENESNVFVGTNITLLKIVLNNILNNANKYAFDNFMPGNKVVIEVDEISDRRELKIVIKNNGKPFPKNFTKNNFITKFSTTDKSKGFGIGGYDIDRILNWFAEKEYELDCAYDEYFETGEIIRDTKKNIKSNWQLILDEHNEYPVSFVFSINFYPVIVQEIEL